MTRFATIAEYSGDDPSKGKGSLFAGPGNLRLAPGADSFARVGVFSIGSISIGQVMSTGHDVEVSEPFRTTILVPIQGQVVSAVGDTSLRATAGEALLLSPNRRKTRVIAEPRRPFLGIPLIVPTDDIENAIERLGGAPGRRAVSASYAIRLAGASGAPDELIRLVEVLYGEIGRDSPRLSRAENHHSWSTLLTEKLVEVLHATDVIRLVPAGGTPAAVARYAKRALDYMHSQYADIETIADVARVCDVSIRTLEDAFRKTWGLTPHTALTEIRLNEARHQLIQAGGAGSVSEIAIRCGFRHFGRFAASYRRRFGEPPSATLSRG